MTGANVFPWQQMFSLISLNVRDFYLIVLFKNIMFNANFYYFKENYSRLVDIILLDFVICSYILCRNFQFGPETSILSVGTMQFMHNAHCKMHTAHSQCTLRIHGRSVRFSRGRGDVSIAPPASDATPMHWCLICQIRKYNYLKFSNLNKI